MGFGLNVQLVFRSALNIVQLFTAAAVVTVVQHSRSFCSQGPKFAQNGVFYCSNFDYCSHVNLSHSTTQHTHGTISMCISMCNSMCKETFTPTHLHNRHLPTHLVVGLLLGAPNVELLLFTALAVVLLFMFNMNNSRGLPTFYCSTSPYHPVKCD